MMSLGGSIVASLENVNGFLAVYTPSDDLIRTDFEQKGVVPKIMFHILEEFVFLLGRYSLDNEIPRMIVCKGRAHFDAGFLIGIDDQRPEIFKGGMVRIYNAFVHDEKNQGDVNDAMGSKKKTVVVTSDPLALIAEKTNEGHFAKDCKKVKVKDYEYYKTKMLITKKDKDEQVLLAEDQAWMESSNKMSRDVLTVGSTMRISLLYREEYLQWVERFMNYLEEQTNGEAMINSIKNDKSMWSDQEKRIQKIDRLAGSLLIQGLSNDIYSLIDSNKTAKDLWDALARHMLGSEYGEQDRKAAVLYEYETFKATEGELFLDTYIRYLQVINDLKKCGYSKDNCEFNFKFLDNLQLE
nr:hypothetical protein [Tanacetum cinerariifolium]